MNPTLKARLEAALETDGYKGLIDLVRQMEAEGRSQVEIYDLFGQSMMLLRAEERESDEDRVTDVMDFITGWCGSDLDLFPHPLSNEEIEAYRARHQTEN